MFKVKVANNDSAARAGVLTTGHGKLATPFFMPDATRGFLRLTGVADLSMLGLGAMVVNTYHLSLQPGTDVIRRAGGIHRFMSWPGPLLADSGGFQVYSLIRQARNKKPLGRMTDRAAIFKSPVDGREITLTPEKSVAAQFALGVDMMVCLDDCPPNDAPRAEIELAVTRTLAWAARSKKEFDRQLARIAKKGGNTSRPLLFSVIQGGEHTDLRKQCADGLIKIGFDGYGFGARPVDKDGKFLGRVLEETADLIPRSALRFALGVGLPEDIIRCVRLGWDMFDCVIPTREGRHGRLFLWNRNTKSEARNPKQFPKSKIQNPKFYNTINITNAKFKTDKTPINSDSRLPELRLYSRGYLNYLFKIGEPLGARLASLNNLEFYLELMEKIRADFGRSGKSRI
jgi:queuine tRNA-ribosyltransferase